MNIFFITGTSGAGKTTLMHHLRSSLSSEYYAIYDFDENGVPTDADRAWRIATTSFWLNKAIENNKQQKTTILCGVSVPSEVLQVIDNNNLPISPFFGFIKIDEVTIKNRLQERGWNEQLIVDNINWAHLLEAEVKQQKNSLIVEDINITSENIATQFISWITTKKNDKKNMFISIRQAQPNDMPSLASLFLESRRSAFTWEDQTKFKLEDFYIQTKGEVIMLAEDQHKTILGLISIWEKDSFIHHLFISPHHQKQGIGTLLIQSLTAWLPLPWKLKCLIKNKKALHFYDKIGFIKIGDGTSDDGKYVLYEYR